MGKQTLITLILRLNKTKDKVRLVYTNMSKMGVHYIYILHFTYAYKHSGRYGYGTGYSKYCINHTGASEVTYYSNTQ